MQTNAVRLKWPAWVLIGVFALAGCYGISQIGRVFVHSLTPPPLPGQPTDAQLANWLNTLVPPEELVSLREKDNVVNIALLGGEPGRYSAELGVDVRDQSWLKFAGNKYGVSLVARQLPSSTAVRVNRNVYVVNVFQGFVDEAFPTTFFFVDGKGQMFVSEESRVLRVLRFAQEQLPLNISPNPNLSLPKPR